MPFNLERRLLCFNRKYKIIVTGKKSMLRFISPCLIPSLHWDGMHITEGRNCSNKQNFVKNSPSHVWFRIKCISFYLSCIGFARLVEIKTIDSNHNLLTKRNSSTSSYTNRVNLFSYLITSRAASLTLSNCLCTVQIIDLMIMRCGEVTENIR